MLRETAMTKEINPDDFNHPDAPPSGIHQVTHTANKELWCIHFEVFNYSIYLHTSVQSYKDYTGANHFEENTMLRACVCMYGDEVHICIPEEDGINMRTVVHESVHAVMKMLDQLGIEITPTNHEVLAYCVDFLSSKIGSIVYKLEEEAKQLADKDPAAGMTTVVNGFETSQVYTSEDGVTF